MNLEDEKLLAELLERIDKSAGAELESALANWLRAKAGFYQAETKLMEMENSLARKELGLVLDEPTGALH
jgi:hypothetical protein